MSYAYQIFNENLEPDVINNLRRADILFIGNSRIGAVALKEALRPYFAKRRLTFFIFNLPGATSEIYVHLIRKFKLRPKLMIVNGDRFFQIGMNERINSIMKGGWFTRLLLSIDYLIATRLIGAGGEKNDHSSVSAKAFTVYESQADGTVTYLNSPESRYPVGDTKLTADRAQLNADERKLFQYQLPHAREFLAQTSAIGANVIFTYIPVTGTSSNRTIAYHIAETFKTPFFEPKLEGLETFDTSHLAPEHANRWIAAFLSGIQNFEGFRTLMPPAQMKITP